jgi:Tol biopolymer transport system component
MADRTGKLSGASLASGIVSSPRFSPNGSRLLYQRATGSSGWAGEIHVLDLRRGTDSRLTFSEGTAMTPVWSPDGRRFAYMMRAAGGRIQLRLGAADGLGRQDSVPLPPGLAGPLTQWTEAGSRLVFFDARFIGYTVTTDPVPGAPEAIQDTTAAAAHHQISPDGRFVAVVMGNLPNVHVYVQSLVGPPGRWQISTTPGMFPRWTKGGRELIYEAFSGGMLYAVDIDTRESFHAGTPRELFRLPQTSFSQQGNSWTCDDSGQRFVLVVPPARQGQAPIEVASGFQGMVSRK